VVRSQETKGCPKDHLTDSAFFVSLEATNKSNLAGKDAADLELTTNLNSLYTIDCLKKKDYQRLCGIYKDGVKKGYGWFKTPGGCEET
jgi:hypothetical protein